MKQLLSFIILMLMAAMPAAAQSLPFLQLSPDARSVGLAGSDLAGPANAYALCNNPAAMSLSQNTVAVGVSYGVWQPQVSDNTLIGFSGFGKITGNLSVGFAGRYFMYQPYARTSSTGVFIDNFTPEEYAIELGLAYRIIKGLSAGVNLRYANSHLEGDARGNAVAADVAVMYSFSDLSFTAALTNLGTKINYGHSDYSLPTLAKLGVGYNLHFSRGHAIALSVEGDYRMGPDSGVMAGAGVEYGFRNRAFLRAGYHFGDDSRAVIPSYASLGLGFEFAGIALNAAYVLTDSDSPLKNSFSLSLGYHF